MDAAPSLGACCVWSTQPLLAKGQSTVITAPTGTGKTLAYAIPLAARVLELHSQSKKLGASKVCRALVVVPTRELARQVQSVLDSLLAPPARKLKQGAVGPSLRRLVGEISHARLATLATDPPAVVVGTPQTLASLIPQRLSLQGCACLVLDEADSLLSENSYGYTMAILKAASRLKERPWIAMVTATVTPAVDTAARRYMRLKKGEVTRGAIRSGRPDPLDPDATPAGPAASGVATGGVQTVDLSRSEGRYSLAPGVIHTGVVLRQEGGHSGAAGSIDAGPEWAEPTVVQRARAAGILLSGKVALGAAGTARQRIKAPALAFANSAATARAVHAALLAGASAVPYSASGRALLSATAPAGDETEAPAVSPDGVRRHHGQRYIRVLRQAEQAVLDADAAAAAWALRGGGRAQLRLAAGGSSSSLSSSRRSGERAAAEAPSSISVLLQRAATTGVEPVSGRPRKVVAALRAAEAAGLDGSVAAGADLRRAGQAALQREVLEDRGAAGPGWELVLQGTVNRDRARALKRLLSGQAAAALTTDHLARGVDLPGLKTVLCLSPPGDAVTYLHRAGRVGRVRSRLQALVGARVAAERTGGDNDGVAAAGGRAGRRRGREDRAVLLDTDLQPLRRGGAGEDVGAFAYGRVLTLLASEAEAGRFRSLMAGFSFPQAAREAGMGVSVAASAEIAELSLQATRFAGSSEAWELRTLERLDPGTHKWNAAAERA